MNRKLFSALTLAGLLAGAAATAGQAQAADALIVAPSTSEAYVSPESRISDQAGDAAVVEESSRAAEPNAMVVTSDGSRIQTSVYERSDGTLVVPLGGTALTGSDSVEPTGYSLAANEIYRVYDCDVINSTFEWDACDTGAPGY